MKYLITGVAGFLGTNLALRLLSEGHTVVGIDNMSTGFSYNLSLLKKHSSFVFRKHDITRPIPSSFRSFHIDYIYNLACPASPPRYQKDPIHTFRTSIWGVWNLILFAQKEKTPIFHTSTSEVYGDPLVHPQPESYWGNVNPIGKRACYDEGKRGAECLLVDYHRQTGNPIKIVRIFNTYGPYMDPHDGRVISNFISQALRNKPLTIYGDGTQTRSFCYVDDLIEGIIRMEHAPSSFIGPVNLGNPAEFTLLQLAQTLEEVIGHPLSKTFHPLPPDDPKQRRPDISLAKEKLGWSPRTPLSEGLRHTVTYFQELSSP